MRNRESTSGLTGAVRDYILKISLFCCSTTKTISALTPRNGGDHGLTQQGWPDWQRVLPDLAPDQRRRYVRSGWPVALADIGHEAWRRRKKNQLTNDEIYCLGVCAELPADDSEDLNH